MKRWSMYNFCHICKKPLTKKEAKERALAKQIPLCKIHAKDIDAKIKKWLPLFQKMKLF